MSDSLFERFWKLTGAAGRLAWTLPSAIGSTAFSPEKIARITKAVQSLAEMKGAPMKLGQMLSLQEGMFPPEVQQIFALLQSNAPPLPGSEMRAIVEQQAGSHASEIEWFDERPLAAASLGQVHHARLKDGRQIAFKILYPNARKSLSMDLSVLRSMLLLFAPMTAVPVRKILKEVKERLLEEIDYESEKRNLLRARDAYAYPWLKVPGLAEEFCTDRVLAMEYIRGQSIREAALMPEDVRTLFGQRILTLVVDGAIRHQFLHADPNAGNLGFFPDGSLVLYDFGCMKRVPDSIAQNYRMAADHLFRGVQEEVPRFLFNAGIHRADGAPLSLGFLKPYMDFYSELIPDRESFFGDLSDVYGRLWDMGRGDFLETRNIIFPPDVMFIHRTLLGHFGNLRTLKPRGNWRRFIQGLL
jgi:predicted unusual protein kinase regulating ubiquinone biosynthesis (AarF/ABC1/UbiB family)